MKLTSLEKRRERGDMIQVFKIIKGIDKLDSARFFKASHSLHLRGHALKLYKQRSRTEWRKNNFNLRVVDSWNKLPEHVVSAETLNAFKERIDAWFLSSQK